MDINALAHELTLRGYRVFDDATHPLNLNLVALRRTNGTPNAFDDLLACFWPLADGSFDGLAWKCTTDPGTHWLRNPMNPGGTAAIAEGQYRGAYTIGTHGWSNPNFRHKALVQVGPLKIYRDNNRDDVMDYDPRTVHTTHPVGLNIHRASAWGEAVQVDQWSAGCIVLPRAADLAQLLALADESAEYWGNTFTFTLLENADHLLA